MKKPLILMALSSLLTACAVQQAQPLNDEQLALIQQQPIVLKPLPTDFAEMLAVHTRKQKVAAKIIASIMTRSYSHRSEGNSPRERMKGVSAKDAMEKTMREGMADDFAVVQPSKVLQEKLAAHFETRTNAEATQLAIAVVPVAWHLYYGKEDTFTLEYAVDMRLELPAHKIRRVIPCDRVSDEARTRDEWLADDQRHIRAFAEASAQYCADELWRELRIANGDKAAGAQLAVDSGLYSGNPEKIMQASP